MQLFNIFGSTSFIVDRINFALIYFEENWGSRFLKYYSAEVLELHVFRSKTTWVVKYYYFKVLAYEVIDIEV